MSRIDNLRLAVAGAVRLKSRFILPAIVGVVLAIIATSASAIAQVQKESALRARFNTDMDSPLPPLNIDKDSISVSGVSSGGFLAHHFHIIHSSKIAGAGIVAGGPYECAFRGSSSESKPDVWKGMYECTSFMRAFCPLMASTPESGRLQCRMMEFVPATWLSMPAEYIGAPDFYAGPGNRSQSPYQAKEASRAMAKMSLERVFVRSGDGLIDELDGNSNFFKSRVFLFSGGLDGMLPRGVADATVHLYSLLYERHGVSREKFNQNVEYVTDLPAAHAIIRDEYIKNAGNIVQPCDEFDLKGSFINTCTNISASCSAARCQQVANMSSACPFTISMPDACDIPSVEICKSRCDNAVSQGRSSNAGDILQHIYGQLNAPDPTQEPRDVKSADWVTWAYNRMYAFDQNAYSKLNTDQTSLGREGYVFIPERCDPRDRNSVRPDGERVRCRLHVAFHGCGMGYVNKVQANEKPYFPLFSGFNEWAAANDIVVLYPQVQAQNMVWKGALPEGLNVLQHTNPGGCGDLWGYTDDKYATYEGVQLRAVARMVNAIIGDESFLRISAREVNLN